MGKGLRHLRPLHVFNQSELWIWISTKAKGGWEQEVPPAIFEADGGDLDKHINMMALTKDIEDVAEKRVNAQEACVIQFLGVVEEEALEQSIIHGKFRHWDWADQEDRRMTFTGGGVTTTTTIKTLPTKA